MKIGALGPSKTIVFHWRVCKYHYVHLSPKSEPKSITYGFRSILETSGKNNQKQHRTVEEMGIQRDPKSEPKPLKKGPHHTLSLLWAPWVPMGCQGPLLHRLWLHVWWSLASTWVVFFFVLWISAAGQTAVSRAVFVFKLFSSDTLGLYDMS